MYLQNKYDLVERKINFQLGRVDQFVFTKEQNGANDWSMKSNCKEYEVKKLVEKM